MYSVISILLLVFFLIFSGSFLAVLGKKGAGTIRANAASAFTLLLIFVMMVISCSSFDELNSLFDAYLSGTAEIFHIELLGNIADYGSLSALLREAPQKAVVSFMDIVLLSTLIHFFCGFPLLTGEFRTSFLSNILVGAVVGLVSLYLLNTVIKTSQVYQIITTLLGVLVSAISLGSIPMLIAGINGSKSAFGILMIVFSICRKALLSSVVFLLGIWLLEQRFGSLAVAADLLCTLAVVLIPSFLTIVGIVYLVVAALRRP